MAQLKIQAYLEKNKISALFEEMMSKLIQEQPEEPLPYLSRMLDRKWEKIRPKRENSPARMRTAPSPSALRKSMPAGASTWAGNSEGAVTKDREYDRPWLTNAKRSRSKGRSGMEGQDNIRPEKKEKAGWNPNTQKVPTGDFDELFKLTKGSKGMKGSKSVDFAMLQDQLGKDLDESLRHSQPIYYGQPRDQALREEDSLSSELKAPMSSRSGEEETSSVDLDLRTVKPHQQALQHKRQLEAIVKQKETASDSGLEEPEDDEEYEEGLELLENEDDLAKEGVTNVVQSGHKISSSLRRPPTPEPQVKVTICGRCARLLSEDTSVVPNGQTPDFNSEVSGRGTPKAAWNPPLTDDEFESVSQVEGPRAPVWYAEESETEVSRKGASMLTKDPRPVKGRPMFSPEPPQKPLALPAPLSSAEKQPRPTTNSALSVALKDDLSDFGNKKTKPARAFALPKDDSEDENGTVKSATALSLGGRSWHAPPETDAESVDYERDRVGRVTGFREHKRRP
ncbi:C8orf34 [Branchiostoma lanceolatum]|uniref:C8orf34 protein n=1 Tax=Branchiostoma lanceolatum TaxID=7740 RepID=A0A8J9Z6Q1_BRALA|nr:C8orf34 [Branchiostoma lanceolatum]